MTQVEQKTVYLRHLVLANLRASQIMSFHTVGRNRFDAVPKEQPPRKLSGKRTNGRTELWREASLHL